MMNDQQRAQALQMLTQVGSQSNVGNILKLMAARKATDERQRQPLGAPQGAPLDAAMPTEGMPPDLTKLAAQDTPPPTPPGTPLQGPALPEMPPQLAQMPAAAPPPGAPPQMPPGGMPPGGLPPQLAQQQLSPEMLQKLAMQMRA